MLILLIVVSALGEDPRPAAHGRGLVVILALVGFALGIVATRALLRRPGRAQWATIAVLIGSSAVLMWAQPNGPGAIGVLLGVFFLARLLPRRVAAAVAVAAVIVLAVTVGLQGQGPGIALLALLGGFFGMTWLSRQLAVANQQAERMLVELQASRAAEARAVSLAEGQRLAREMHDVLAHSLSGLMLQLEGARMLAAQCQADPRLAEVIERAHHLAKSGLKEARGAIGMLREEELPGPERLAELAARFRQDRGIPCCLSVSGQVKELGAEARVALYRVAQEALTNIAKHAEADRVELHLAYEPGATRLTVEDFTAMKRTMAAPGVGGGYGLTGMRERAELLGGTLIAEPTSAGFRVELEVPA